MPAAHVVLIATLAVAAWTDLRRHKIPNTLTYPAIALCLAVSYFDSGLDGLPFSLMGTLVCGGLMFLAWLPGALGGGDVKLAAVMGAALGWANGLSALMWMFTLAAIWMLSTAIWTDGPQGVWRSLSPQPLPSDTATMPPQTRPMYLAPAALAAAVIITWP